MAAEGRYSRNELLFGAVGQKLIGEANVGVVGLGGLGSHIGQQLAYLGVLDYVLVDADEVTESSLNRLIGASVDEVGTKKVAVAARLIQTVQPEARIVPVEALLPAEEAFEALADRSYVFGCLDEDPPRQQLTDFTTQRGITYIDTASDVFPEGEYGGRIVTAKGHGCLFCLGEIDQEELRRAGMSPDQRRADDEIYGVSRDALAEAGPSVVSLNGVVASLAVDEFMVDVTGMGEPVRFINYRADQRTVGRRAAEPEPRCPYCSRWPTSESA
ncbi:MAG: ThiF family adenylyltransferase [Actinomycetota bacterium]